MENNFVKELQEKASVTQEQAEKVVNYLKEKFKELGSDWHKIFSTVEEKLTDNNVTDVQASNADNEKAEHLGIHSDTEDIEDGGYMKGNQPLHLMEHELYKAASTNGKGTTIGSLNER